MENEYVVVKKGPGIWKIIGIILAIAGVCFVAYKVYTKFFRKAVPAANSDGILDSDDAEEIVPAEDAFEVDASSVISNAAEMEAEG